MKTRMHSSRMHSDRALTAFPSVLGERWPSDLSSWGGGGSLPGHSSWGGGGGLSELSSWLVGGWGSS